MDIYQHLKSLIEDEYQNDVEQTTTAWGVEDPEYAGDMAEWTFWRDQMTRRLDNSEFFSVYKDLVLSIESEGSRPARDGFFIDLPRPWHSFERLPF